MPTAVLLDRDGVLIEDIHLLRERRDIQLLAGVPEALQSLSEAGFKLIVVSNQAIVARGLASEDEIRGHNAEVQRQVTVAGGPALDGFYFCPHHPSATLARYREDCGCRKPRPGMLLRAAAEHDLDLSDSFMIGDRVTDIIAGARAGCRTIQVETGCHRAPPIETVEPLERTRPDHRCAGLAEAARWILAGRRA